MDPSSLSPTSVTATQASMIRETAGTLVLRKVLDMEAAQGAMLAQMVAQSAGVGRNVDVSA